jgi:Cu+-exporting ATPase
MRESSAAMAAKPFIPFCATAICSVFMTLPENSVASLKEKPASDYSYCDSPWFREMFVKTTANGTWSLSLKLPDIHCAACVWLLEKLPEMLPGMTGARINYLRKQLTVSATADVTPAQVIQLVADLGYAPDFSRESAATQKLSAYDKSLLRRMAVAAFAFGNAMLFSLPEYFSSHVESAFAKTFIVLNAALATFVLFYSAGEFFKSAWRALKKEADRYRPADFDWYRRDVCAQRCRYRHRHERRLF